MNKVIVVICDALIVIGKVLTMPGIILVMFAEGLKTRRR